MNRILDFLEKHLSGAYHIKLNEKKQLNVPKLGIIATLGIIFIGIGESLPILQNIGLGLIGLSVLSYIAFYILPDRKSKD
jgi:Na+/citrate or Na+/malate symporter